MTKGDQVREYLAQHYTCAVMPFGSVSEIAVMFGVSREYVRQIAQRLGYQGYSSLALDRRSPRGRTGRTLCPKCREPYGVKRYESDRIGVTHCEKCRWVVLACVECGKPKKMLASHYESRTRNPNNRYTGRVFCDLVCFGRWAGKHVGFSAHPENALHGSVSAMYAMERRQGKIMQQLSDKPRTLAELTEATGMGERAIRANLRRLAEAGKVCESRKTTTGRAMTWTRQ